MNTENRISIGKINGAEIFAVSGPDGETFVPIKPICEALSINVQAQQDKIKEHPIFAPVTRLSRVTGADGKQYEMVCIDLEFVYGWILSINPGNVAKHSRENMIKYQKECHHILYQHFFGRASRTQEYIDIERSLKTQKEKLGNTLSELMKSVADVKAQIRDIDSKFADLQTARLDPQPSLFD